MLLKTKPKVILLGMVDECVELKVKANGNEFLRVPILKSHFNVRGAVSLDRTISKVSNFSIFLRKTSSFGCS